MSGQASSDRVMPMESFESGAGQGRALFDIKDMGLLPNFLKGMFSAAEQTVSQVFGDQSQMLPFNDNSKV